MSGDEGMMMNEGRVLVGRVERGQILQVGVL